MILLKGFPDETVFRLFPARVNALGRGIRRILFPSALAPLRCPPLPFHICSGPVGSVGGRDEGEGMDIW
jgi:hypothetical protein